MILYGVLSIIAGVIALVLPETRKQPLNQRVQQCEHFIQTNALLFWWEIYWCVPPQCWLPPLPVCSDTLPGGGLVWRIRRFRFGRFGSRFSLLVYKLFGTTLLSKNIFAHSSNFESATGSADECATESAETSHSWVGGEKWLLISPQNTRPQNTCPQNAYFWPISGHFEPILDLFPAFQPFSSHLESILGLFQALWPFSFGSYFGLFSGSLGLFQAILNLFWAFSMLFGPFHPILIIFWAFFRLFRPISGHFEPILGLF